LACTNLLVKAAEICSVHEDDVSIFVMIIFLYTFLCTILFRYIIMSFPAIYRYYSSQKTKGSYFLKTCSHKRRALDAVCRVDLSLEEV